MNEVLKGHYRSFFYRNAVYALYIYIYICGADAQPHFEGGTSSRNDNQLSPRALPVSACHLREYKKKRTKTWKWGQWLSGKFVANLCTRSSHRNDICFFVRRRRIPPLDLDLVFIMSSRRMRIICKTRNNATLQIFCDLFKYCDALSKRMQTIIIYTKKLINICPWNHYIFLNVLIEL